MRFRQRIAWLVTVIFLGATCALAYYIFEINEHFNKFAVDHVEKYHSDSGTSPGIWHHIIDIPVIILFIIFLLAYLQVFFMILACTKTEPRHSLAYNWPSFLFTKLKMVISNCSIYVDGSQKSQIIPGSVTIET